MEIYYVYESVLFWAPFSAAAMSTSYYSAEITTILEKKKKKTIYRS